MQDQEPANRAAKPTTVAEPAPVLVQRSRWATSWRNLSSRWVGWIAATALACAVIALSVALVTSGSATTTAHVMPGTGFAAGTGVGGGGSNARSGPAAGGATGTVDSRSTAGFTMSTATGQKVTVIEASSTKYQDGANSTSAQAVTTGVPVLVLGTTSGTTITATDVIVRPTGDGGSATAGVVPFQRGSAGTSKQVGQIPANYTEGSGTIVDGTVANKATQAALAAYPGGIVDRVVKLSNGEFEVHNIGVSWPHHVFLSADFSVVGAD